MSRKAAQLAKLTRPRLYGAIQRARLFTKLDEARAQRPAICLVAPPGAGKTTLIASWLEARKLPGIWYQVDAGDSDPATFFYYLGEAARPFGARRVSRMPLLSPEYREDLPGFSRRFFRELYSRLPQSATLVLDNCQEVGPDATFHEFVADSVAEISDGITLVMISRRDPPATYSRLVANERVSFLDWNDLQLALEETRAIAAARMAVTETEISRLHMQCGGWVAGLTLLVEGERRQTAARDPGPGEGHELIFNYFADQIFTELPKRVRQFLMATACLPQVAPGVARELTGESKSLEILRDLYQRHLFVHRRSGLEPTYWYHALFRSFLLAQAERDISQAKRRSIGRKAGQLFEKNEEFDGAFELYCSVEEWDAATALVLRCADSLVHQGRGELLCAWIERLPVEFRDAQPWLAYWLGAGMLPTAPTRARARLERAFAGFAHCGDGLGKLQAAADIIQSYLYDWSDLLPLNEWMEVLAGALADSVGSADLPLTLQLKAYTGMVIAMLYRQPDHTMLAESVERVEALLSAGLNSEQRLTAATVLVGYYTLTGDLGRAERVVERTEPLLDDPSIPPAKLAWWWIRVQFFQGRLGAYEEAQNSLRRARDLAEANGLQSLRSLTVLTASFENELLANLGSLQQIQRNIERTALLIDHSVPMQVWWVESDRDWFDLSRGHCSLEHVRETTDIADRSGGAYARIDSRIAYAHALCLSSDRRCVPMVLEEIRQMIRGTCFSRWESELKLVQVFAMLRDGERSTLPEALLDAFSQCRQTRYCHAHRSTKGMLSALCAEALALDIEVGYVREIIARYRITAPADAGETWPWRVKVYTLGHFRVLIDDRLLSFSHKVPKKLVALLKAIVASGRNNMPSGGLMDMLWPDQDGDSAYQALAKSVQRLRHLLGDDQAVALLHGKVSLDPARVWVDAFEFERVVASQHLTNQVHRLQRALELYRGVFMEDEEETPWCLAARKRLRAKFISLILTSGRQLESTGDWTAAERCYSRALEIDSAAEEFGQRLRDATSRRPQSPLGG